MYEFFEQAAPHLEQAFVHSLGVLAGDRVGNAVLIDRSGELTQTGSYMDLPKIDEPSTPQRRDVSTTSQTRTFTEMGNSKERAPILHDDTADVVPVGNKTFTGLDFQKFWMQRQGWLFGRRVKQSLYRMARAAVEAVDSPTADCHIHDCYAAGTNNTMTLTRLQGAKAKMGDAAGQLVCAVMHSTCWNNLVLDGIGNYKVENVAGVLIREGGIEDPRQKQALRRAVGYNVATVDALGMVIVIDDDMTCNSKSGSTYTYASEYETLLLTPGSLIVSYQRDILPQILKDLDDARGAVWKMRSEVDYAVHLQGMTWGGAMNPTDTQLGTKSNYSMVASNHKEVGCVKLVTNG